MMDEELESAINKFLDHLPGTRKITMCALSWLNEDGTAGSASWEWVKHKKTTPDDLTKVFAALMHAVNNAIEEQAEDLEGISAMEFLLVIMKKALALKMASARGEGRTIKVKEDFPPGDPPRSSRIPPQRDPPGL